MSTAEQLRREAQEIQDYLELVTPADGGDPLGDIQQIDQRARTLQAYMARTGHMLAIAKAELMQKKKQEIQQLINSVLKGTPISATVQNELVKSLCAEEEALLTWIDRLNRAATHQLDLCRSQMANYRAELAMNTWGGGAGVSNQ